MRHERAMGRAAMALALLGAIVGGCDMSQIGQPMGMVPREEYNRAVADARRQREEADRQRAQAQQWQAQAEQARAAKGAAIPPPNDDLLRQIEALTRRVQNLEGDLARATEDNKALQDENHRLRSAPAPQAPRTAGGSLAVPPVEPPAPQAPRTAGGPTLQPVKSPPLLPPAGHENPAAVIVTATTAPAPVPAPAPAPAALSPAERERQRLLAEAAKELTEAKEALGPAAATPVEPAAATSQPGGGETPEATPPAPVAPARAGLTGAVTQANGAQVTINLGARNGLKKDTRMYLHRGTEFIGVLQLTVIGARSAQGFVDGKLGAKVGDQAVVFGD